MSLARKNLTTDPLSNQIALIIQLAKVKGDEEDRTYWNYYGDPATSVWESTN